MHALSSDLVLDDEGRRAMLKKNRGKSLLEVTFDRPLNRSQLHSTLNDEFSSLLSIVQRKYDKQDLHRYKL